MPRTAGKRLGMGSVLSCVAMALPVAAGGYIIYQKQQSLPVVETQAAPQEPQQPERVAVAPRYADEEALERKRLREEELQRERNASRRAAEQAAADDAAAKASKKRVITLGPSANPEQWRTTNGPDQSPPPPQSGMAQAAPPEERTGPKIYQALGDGRDGRARDDDELREKGYRQGPAVGEKPLLPFSGGSSYGSTTTRSRSSGSIR